MSAKRLSRCALSAALCVALLYAASVVPSGRLALTAAAGLALTPLILYAGWMPGLWAYISAVLLSLVLIADKHVFWLFLIFFGPYPSMKALFERMRRRWWSWAVKCLWANGMLALWLWLGQAVLGTPEWLMSRPVLLFLLYNIAFFVYDIGYSQLYTYLRRFDKIL